VARIIQSWDTAIKAAAGNDYSVCTTWAETESGYHLLDIWRRRAEYPELKRAVLNVADQWQPDAILMEDKASGQSLLQDLKRETKLPLVAIMPHKDKVTRMAAVSALFEAGKVMLPERAPWLAELEAELAAFPHGAHDDQCDSISQALNWMRRKASISARARRI
jgi:predicted phage terminase large subunit-like protein